MKPLFICGLPRTGSTIMAKVINTNPEIMMTSENRLPFILAQFLSRLSCHYPETDFDYGLNCTRQEFHFTKTNLALHFAEAIQAIYTNKPNAKYFGDKYPHMIQFIPEVFHMFPNAKIIITTRDREKVLHSILNQIWGHKQSKVQWQAMIDRHEAIEKELIKLPNVKAVDLKDVKENSVRVFQEIADWLGVENKFNLSEIKHE